MVILESILHFIREYFLSNFFLTLFILFVYQQIHKPFSLKLVLKIFSTALKGFFVFQFIVLLFEIFFFDYLPKNQMRATGPYAFAFWTIIVSNYVLPFLLFSKSGKNLGLVMFTSFTMNFAFYMERYVQLVTTYHLDFSENTFGPLLWSYFMKFLLIPVLLSLAFITYDKMQNKQSLNTEEMEDIL